MGELTTLFIHPIVTAAKLMRPGGRRCVVAESLLLKHQLLILNRGGDRAPNLRPIDRVIAGLCTLVIRPGRLLRLAIVLRPSTLLAFHAVLVKRKYRRLFSAMRKTACEALIYFAASRSLSRAIGYSLSWINTHVESLLPFHTRRYRSQNRTLPADFASVR